MKGKTGTCVGFVGTLVACVLLLPLLCGGAETRKDIDLESLDVKTVRRNGCHLPKPRQSFAFRSTFRRRDPLLQWQHRRWGGNVDDRQLEWFCRAYEARSFSKAAERAFVSRQALGKAVKSLETELGVALFVRSEFGLAPTSAC